MLKLTAAMVLLVQVHTSAPNKAPVVEAPPYDWLDDVVKFFENANRKGGIAVPLDRARRGGSHGIKTQASPCGSD